MATILFNAFSFLQEKLKAKDHPCINAHIELSDGSTVADLVSAVGLEAADVEAALVNGSVRPFDTLLQNGDRVALIPPGTPGPYRVLLGMAGRKKAK
ncbi:MAG: MoaD/ThiS family protein [Deltaproteobacteria bacterium]|nr:MoaD/ThiS family protein [Deltaproteobacteria bacterium]